MPLPNILLIVTDQYRFDATGLNGGWVRTPVLDGLAGEGVNFTNCYANSPICMPTRISLATGLYPHNTNVWSNIHTFLSEESSVWTQYIRHLGYRTAVFGKTHLYTHHVEDLRDYEGILRAGGFQTIDEIPGPRAAARTMSNMGDRWQRNGLLQAYRDDFRDRFATKPHVVRPSVLPLEEYADVYVASQAQEFLATYSDSQPWFCWLSFGGPHEPWDTPEPYANMYRPENMPEPIMPVDASHSRPHGNLDLLRGLGSAPERRHAGQESRIADPVDTSRFHPDFQHDDIARMRASYAGNCTLIDEQIGRVMETIRSRNEMDNTIVVFTSDHGEMNGDYGLVYKKNFLDSAARVPLIVRTPETASTSTPSRTCSAFIEWFDIGPTLVDLVGGEISHRQFARSFTELLGQPGAVHRQDALSEVVGEHMLVNDQWKIALNTEGQAYMLFNRYEDPQETNNLAGLADYEETERALRLRILERLSASHMNEGCP